MSLFNVFKKEMNWGNSKLIIETGKIARQADGAVVVSLGGTKVIATVVASRKCSDNLDFFPLTVSYIEKAYAAGRIPGSFMKREGRPSEHETLVSRLIDRPIRPLFAENFKNETQVIITVLSYDKEHQADIVSMIATSAALSISGLPFLGPIAGARVGLINDEFILNPTTSQLEESSLDLVVAGTKDGVLMVESEAKELSENIMLDAVMFAHENIQSVINLISELKDICAKPDWGVKQTPTEQLNLYEEIKQQYSGILSEKYKIVEKTQRRYEIDALKEEILLKYQEQIKDEDNIVDTAMISVLFKQLEKDVVRSEMLNSKLRIDGRTMNQVRTIESEVGLLENSHGSALFTRGETQALVVITLGSSRDEQLTDNLDGEHKVNFLLHYNFPPYSVGEVGRVGSPGRREIGHGKLAYRSVNPIMPSKEEFPYTVRVVSEITESNGSSSMATVCGTSLALMDAGVPLKKPIAGIAMGLIKEDNDFIVLSDIMGDEDHLGDMDFKVAGTKDGITSLQMDIKITSITKEIMEQALNQALDGRNHILGEMSKTIEKSNTSLSPYAPLIQTIKVPVNKIRDVIGAGGKTVREITESTGCKIDIEDDGQVQIIAANQSSGKQALEWIISLVEEPEINAIYEGTVVKIIEFGAFVNFWGNNDGFVHISEFKNERVENIEDVAKVGDTIKIKLLGQERGKYKLSARVVDQKTGAELKDTRPPQQSRSGGGGGPSSRPRGNR